MWHRLPVPVPSTVPFVARRMTLLPRRCVRYVDEALRDLTGYPTQMLRMPHTLLSNVAKRILAAQYAATQVSTSPWTVAEEVVARQALSVRLQYVAVWGCRPPCWLAVPRSYPTMCLQETAGERGNAWVLPQMRGPAALLEG